VHRQKHFALFLCGNGMGQSRGKDKHLSAPQFVHLAAGCDLQPAAEHVHIDDTGGFVFGQMREAIEGKDCDR